MSISYKFFSWFSTSDSIEKDGTYLYSENINTFNPEFIEVSPDTKNIIKTGEEIKFILPDVEWIEEEMYRVTGNRIFDILWNLIYDHWIWISNNNHYIRNWIVVWYKIYNNYIVIYSGYKRDNNDAEYNEEWFIFLSPRDRNISWKVQCSLYNPKIQSFSFLYANWFISIANRQLIQLNINSHTKTIKPSFNAVWVDINSNWYKVFWYNGNLTLWEWDKEEIDKQGNKKLVEEKQIYNLNINIFSVAFYSGINYLFSLDWLYFLNGILASPIFYKYKSNYLNFEKFNFDYSPKFWVVRNWKFIYSACKTEKWIDICVLWAKVVWSSINFSSVVSKPWEKVTSMVKYKDWILISYKHKDWSYWIDYFSFENNQKCESGVILTKEYYGDSLVSIKTAKKIKLYCDKLKSWEYLKISASINNQDFFEIKTLTENDRWKDWYFEIVNFNREFHKIVFKIEIKGNFKLYDFIFYDEKR